MPLLVPLGRVLFSLIFMLGVAHHFSHETIAAASAHGVPLAHVAVPLAGILAFAGGLSIALGYHARIGAILVLAFLVPVTLVMHKFWGVADPQQAAMQYASFMKNTALAGAALLFVYGGSGPYSLAPRAGSLGVR